MSPEKRRKQNATTMQTKGELSVSLCKEAKKKELHLYFIQHVNERGGEEEEEELWVTRDQLIC